MSKPSPKVHGANPSWTMANTYDLPPSWRDFELDELKEIFKIRDEKLNQTTLYIFTCNHIFYLLTLWATSRVTEFILRRVVPNMSATHVKNCTTYILEIIFTTVILVIQISIYPVLRVELNYTNYQLSQTCCLLMVDLYIFELIYRSMRIPLIFHHLISIAINVIAYYVLIDTLGVILIFQATTEQTTFFGLLFYRLKPSWAAPVLFFSAVQVFLAKVAGLIWAFTFWGIYLLPNPAGLFMTQLWSAYVVWVIALRARRTEKERKESVQKEMSTSGFFQEKFDATQNESLSTTLRRLEGSDSGHNTTASEETLNHRSLTYNPEENFEIDYKMNLNRASFDLLDSIAKTLPWLTVKQVSDHLSMKSFKHFNSNLEEIKL
ncbi:hypothetical protein G9A89_000917 [Geosiphon pyriformis]|nr:hypothetical protein G9A89_000917 [Geosiphon pyriformis]